MIKDIGTPKSRPTVIVEVCSTLTKKDIFSNLVLFNTHLQEIDTALNLALKEPLLSLEGDDGNMRNSTPTGGPKVATPLIKAKDLPIEHECHGIVKPRFKN